MGRRTSVWLWETWHGPKGLGTGNGETPRGMRLGQHGSVGRKPVYMATRVSHGPAPQQGSLLKKTRGKVRSRRSHIV